MSIENGEITSTLLGLEGHGILSCSLMIEGVDWGQGFGGYAFDKHNGLKGDEGARIGTAWGMEFVRRILEVVGVDAWEKLKGKHVRIQRENYNGPIVAIGHITKDKWLCPKQDLILAELAAKF